MDLACFHIPDFAAWALARRWCEGDPTAAVAACAGGRVLACTPALKHSIAIGDPVERARRLAPHAQFLLRDPAVERALWDHFLYRLYGLTPQVQPIPDPLRSTGPGSSRTRTDEGMGLAPGLWDNGAWAWLQGPDRCGLERLAGELEARVGVASGRSWSLLAAAYADPGRLTTVPAHMVSAFLRQAPIGLLTSLRFSVDLIERLRSFGMRAVGHATHLTRRQLHAQFGAEGMRLFELLHPPAAEPPVTPFDPRVVRIRHDFEWSVFEPGQLQPVLHHLLAQLATRLDGRSARHLEVCLRGRGALDRSASRVLREPTQRLDVLRTAADVLLLTALTASSPDRRPPSGRSVQRLTVTLSGLIEVPARQSRLFSHRSDRLPALVRAMDVRFPGKLLRPVRAHADPFFPEEEYRFEPVAR